MRKAALPNGRAAILVGFFRIEQRLCAKSDEEYAQDKRDRQGELHAGEGETSKMLAIAPETVHMDRAVDFIPTVPRPYLSYGSIFRASPTGVWGEPTKATAEKGERILERLSEICVEEANKAFDYMSNKEKINYSYF